jgi:hypothetical protein
MHLAQSFCLDIERSPLFRFLEKACRKEGWTSDSLRREWADTNSVSKDQGKGAPYPLPEGAEPITV